ncbi:MAG: hypothetical protein QW279_05950 [Candidatus Jordarchaeaceae archaeon]
MRSIASRLVDPVNQSTSKPVPDPVPLGRGGAEPEEAETPPVYEGNTMA